MNVACCLLDHYDFKPRTPIVMSYDESDLGCIVSLAVVVAGGMVASHWSKDPYPELLHLGRKVEPEFVFCHKRNAHWATQLERDLHHRVVCITMGERDTIDNEHEARAYSHVQQMLAYDSSASPARARLPVACDNIEREVAFLLMSSGTTGRPKAVPATHKCCLEDNMLISARRFGVKNFSMACVATLGYVTGRLLVMGAVQTGYSLVLLNGFEPRAYLDAVQKYKVNALYLGAAAFYALITYEHIGQYDLSSVRICFPMGAKIVYMDKLREFFANNPQIKVVKQGYGTSETAGGAMRNATPAEYVADPDSCGQCAPGVRIKVVHPQTGELLGVNQTGELHVHSTTLFPGYYDAGLLKSRLASGDANATPFLADSSVFDADGFYISGDLGYFNDAHELYIVGRQKELMCCRAAKKVVPHELELVLEQHPAVGKACVLGIANKREPTLHCPRAFVVPKKEVHERAYVIAPADTMTPADGTSRPCVDTQQQQDPLVWRHGPRKLCSLELDKRRELAETLMRFVDMRVSWEKQLTGGIVLMDEMPVLRSSGKINKQVLRALDDNMIEIYGDRSA